MERIVTDPAGLKVQQQLVGITDVAGNVVSGFPVTVVDGADVAIGATTDTRTTWYTAAGSLIARIGLLCALIAGAGSHVYGYNGSGQLITDAWTLFGTTRTKTYGWSGTQLTTESDWV